MMLSGPELVLVLLIVFVAFAFLKLPQISRGMARLRLRFDKGIAEEYIEVVSKEKDEEAV